MNPILNVDVAIVGGGIAGLWLLAQLRQRGYGAVLIENAQLGAGQTLCAQGIIHGGAKYALHGQLSDSAKTIAGMPALWRRCLNDADEPDLRAARLLAEHQYLWATRAPTSQLAAFFASQLMQSRMEKVVDDRPAVLRHPDFRGTVYRLDEPIVDVASVLRALAGHHREALLLSQEPVALTAEGTLLLRHPSRPPLTVQAACTVFTAGAGNAGLPWAAQQLRPLHMVMVRGSVLPGVLYAHCLGVSDTPRLTVTSHYDASGRLIWYLGGGLAEEGVKRDRAEQIRATRRELATLLPWVDWSQAEFATFTVQRAEACQRLGTRPAEPSVLENGRVIVAWPTKLALAPLLAERIAALLPTLAVQPQLLNVKALADWPRPEVAPPPWDWEHLQWS